MKNLLILLMLAMSTISFAQNKLHFGLQTNGNLTTGLPIDNSSFAQPFKGLYTLTFCYAAGVTLDYDFNEKLNLQTGVLYRKSGDRSKKEFGGIDVANSGFIFPTNSVPRGGPYGYKFIYYGVEVPLNINYNLNDKLSLGTGASLVYNWKGKAQWHYGFLDNAEYTQVYIPKKLQVAANLLFNYKINEHFYTGLMGQYFFTTTYASDFNIQDLPRNYLSVGLNFGYKL